MDRLRRSLYLRRVARSSGLLIAVLAVIALVAAFSAGTGSSLTLIIPNFFITVIAVIALQMFTGNSGVVSWGHSAFVGIAAYVTAWLTVPSVIKSDVFRSMPSWLLDAQWSFIPTIAVATLAGTLVAALIGLVLCRMKETAMAMSTLALLVIAHGVYANWFGMTRGAQGVYGLPQNTTLWGAFGFACFAVIVGVMFRDSRVGLRLQASREDPLAAEATGVSVVRSRYIAWVSSAALAALGGSVWAQFNLAFDPSQFYYAQVFAVLSMLVIGGHGHGVGRRRRRGSRDGDLADPLRRRGRQPLRHRRAAGQRAPADDPGDHHAPHPHLPPQRHPELVGPRRVGP